MKSFSRAEFLSREFLKPEPTFQRKFCFRWLTTANHIQMCERGDTVKEVEKKT